MLRCIWWMPLISRPGPGCCPTATTAACQPRHSETPRCQGLGHGWRKGLDQGTQHGVSIYMMLQLVLFCFQPVCLFQLKCLIILQQMRGAYSVSHVVGCWFVCVKLYKVVKWNIFLYFTFCMVLKWNIIHVIYMKCRCAWHIFCAHSSLQNNATSLWTLFESSGSSSLIIWFMADAWLL